MASVVYSRRLAFRREGAIGGSRLIFVEVNSIRGPNIITPFTYSLVSQELGGSARGWGEL